MENEDKVKTEIKQCFLFIEKLGVFKIPKSLNSKNINNLKKYFEGLKNGKIAYYNSANYLYDILEDTPFYSLVFDSSVDEFPDEYSLDNEVLFLAYLAKMYIVSKEYHNIPEVDDINSNIDFVKKHLENVDLENCKFIKTSNYRVEDIFYTLMRANKILNYKYNDFVKYIFKMHYTSYFYNFINE